MLSYLHYPRSHRVRISSTNLIERLNLEIRRPHARSGHLPDKTYLSFEDAPTDEVEVS